MYPDKNRKRGIRIAQKSTYKHHARDNSRFYYGGGLGCYDCEGHKNLTCTYCSRLLAHKARKDAMDYELKTGDY